MFLGFEVLYTSYIHHIPKVPTTTTTTIAHHPLSFTSSQHRRNTKSNSGYTILDPQSSTIKPPNNDIPSHPQTRISILPSSDSDVQCTDPSIPFIYTSLPIPLIRSPLLSRPLLSIQIKRSHSVVIPSPFPLPHPRTGVYLTPLHPPLHSTPPVSSLSQRCDAIEGIR